MKTKTTLLLLILGAAMAFGACKSDPHEYRPPSGLGPILYSPERGIYRENDALPREVEKLWYQARVAFDQGEWSEARDALRRFRFEPAIVDSSRALDAIMLESVVALEAGRKDDDAPKWRLHDLADAWLDGQVAPERLRHLPRALLVVEGLEDLKALALRVTDGGYVESAFAVQELIFEHYTYGLGIVPSRMTELSRQMRNLAWFAYVGEDYGLATRIARNLLSRSPRIEVRSTTQLVLAQSLIKDDRAKQAIDVYHEAFETARDPDLREEALLGEVQALIASSKGWRYNREPYEMALEKITEYKTGFLTVYRDAKLVREFSDLEREVHDVLYNKDKVSADVYDRLLEEGAGDFYRRAAGRRRDVQIKAEETLRKIFRKNDEENGDG